MLQRLTNFISRAAGVGAVTSVAVVLLVSRARAGEMKQLTGHTSFSAKFDHGDPSAPEFANDSVRVLVTGGYELLWKTTKSATAEARFFAGEEPEHLVIPICHPDGTPLDDNLGEDAWDPSMENGILFASIMAPSQNRKNAQWPNDAQSRRVYAFQFNGVCWIRELKPFVTNSQPGWLDHNYGHEFIIDRGNQKWVFYEKVTEEQNGLPWKTEMFAKRVLSPLKTDAQEIEVFRFANDKWPALHRSFGGSLAEGPRPFPVAGGYAVSFSGGDYSSSSYGIHILWSENIEGPFDPMRTADGKNLEDLGSELRTRYKLSWGPARAAFFNRNGKTYAIFHAITLTKGEGHRQLFLAPVEVTQPTPHSPPHIKLVD